MNVKDKMIRVLRRKIEVYNSQKAKMEKDESYPPRFKRNQIKNLNRQIKDRQEELDFLLSI